MKKYLSDNDLIFATMSPKEAMEWTGGHDKEKIKHMREVKEKARKQLIENQKPRQENVLERIERVKYEHGETKQRPKHMDNKKVYSFEENFKKNHPNINDKYYNKPVVDKPKKTVIVKPLIDFKSLSRGLTVMEDHLNTPTPKYKPPKEEKLEGIETLFGTKHK